jgi:hypothetical protein
VDGVVFVDVNGARCVRGESNSVGGAAIGGGSFRHSLPFFATRDAAAAYILSSLD